MRAYMVSSVGTRSLLEFFDFVLPFVFSVSSPSSGVTCFRVVSLSVRACCTRREARAATVAALPATLRSLELGRNSV